MLPQPVPNMTIFGLSFCAAISGLSSSSTSMLAMGRFFGPPLLGDNAFSDTGISDIEQLSLYVVAS